MVVLSKEMFFLAYHDKYVKFIKICAEVIQKVSILIFKQI